MKYSLLFALAICAAQIVFADESKSAEESITVTVTGTIRTGVVAIGGETSGVTIKSKGATFELDFGKNAALRQAAEKLDGKTVIVEGTLECRPGVEIKERWIVTVAKFRAAAQPSEK